MSLSSGLFHIQFVVVAEWTLGLFRTRAVSCAVYVHTLISNESYTSYTNIILLYDFIHFCLEPKNTLKMCWQYWSVWVAGGRARTATYDQNVCIMYYIYFEWISCLSPLDVFGLNSLWIDSIRFNWANAYSVHSSDCAVAVVVVSLACYSPPFDPWWSMDSN